jgi:hypothetical protein
LQEISRKPSYDRNNEKDHRRVEYRRRSDEDDSRRSNYKSQYKNRTQSVVAEADSYEQPSYELQPHPAHLMYFNNYYPPPMTSITPPIIEATKTDKKTKKSSKTATRKSKKHKRKKEEKSKTKKKSKKSVKKTKSKKTKDKLIEFVKRKLKENKTVNRKSDADADDCFEVVDLTE